MEEHKNDNTNDIERELKTQFDSIPLDSADSAMEKLRPSLKQKKSRATRHKPIMRLIAAGTGLVLCAGIVLTVLLTVLPPSEEEIRYGYSDIDIVACTKEEILSWDSLYVPNLDILIEPVVYRRGLKKDTDETACFMVEGYHAENDIARTITLRILLDEQYQMTREEDYNTDTRITVAGFEISVLEDEYNAPFYRYKLAFKQNTIRYYIDYGTTSEQNDVAHFMELWLN